MKPTEQLAKYAVDLKIEKIPGNTIKDTKKIFLDWLGVALAGSLASGCEALVGLIRDFDGKKESTLVRYGDRVPSFMAAFANGTMGHALDFDDTHDVATLHTSSCVIPAALALAEREESSGKDLITAIALGMDIHCRMALASGLVMAEGGWHNTPTMGYFGAATAASKILNLNEEKVINAIGIAYHETSGNLQCILDGALTKRLGPGLAAKGGTLAALLAQAGFTGAKQTLEGKYGFYNVYMRGKYNLDKLFEKLGEEFEVSNLSLKPYPCCRCTHTGIDAALEARRKYKIRHEDVDDIEVGMSGAAYSIVCEPLERKYDPRTIVDLQFNMPYAVACALIKGDVFIDDFTEEALSKRKDIISYASKVKPKIDPEIENKEIAPVVMKIKMKNGQEYVLRADIPKGHPKNPMSMEEVIEKVKKSARHARMTEGNVNEIIKIVEDLEKVDNIADLTELLIV